MSGAHRSVLVPVAVFAAFYLSASAADLWTTELALGAGASEGNVYATSGGIYAAAQAWAFSLVGGVLMIWLFAFGLSHADDVSEEWLKRPARSFLHAFYVNFLSASVRDRSPLHMMSLAIGFVLLRLLAAVNNLFLVAGLPAPIGSVVSALARITTPTIGFVVTLALIFVALSVAVSPVAARIIRTARKT